MYEKLLSTLQKLAVNKMREELKAGMTEDELWSIYTKLILSMVVNGLNVEFYLQDKEQIPGCKKVVIKLFNNGEIVSFDTDMVGPYGYCADISRAFVEGHKFNDEQKKLYQMASRTYKS